MSSLICLFTAFTASGGKHIRQYLPVGIHAIKLTKKLEYVEQDFYLFYSDVLIEQKYLS
jgi:hypothetical protein